MLNTESRLCCEKTLPRILAQFLTETALFIDQIDGDKNAIINYWMLTIEEMQNILLLLENAENNSHSRTK